MLYRKNIKTGEDISILGFGAMRMPTLDDGTIDKQPSLEMINYCLDHGVNYFDTAIPYHGGQSEAFLGEALQGVRQDVYIATKMLHTKIEKYEDMEQMFTQQLKNLRTDYIDYYMVHGFVNAKLWHRLKAFGFADFVKKHKASGAIRRIGFSAHMSFPDFKEVLDDFDWDFAQMQYNYIDEDIQVSSKGLAYAESKGIPLIAMEPIRGGLLTTINDEIHGIFDKAQDKKTSAAWALRWVWNHPGFLTVLSGMSTMEQVKQNIETASVALPGSMTDDDMLIINEAIAAFKSKVVVPCTQCGYCMPCPYGVRIPAIFESYNLYHILNEERGKRWYYVMTSGMMGGKGEASLCEECGECESKCPQGIHIIDELKNAKAILAPDETRESVQ
jgi:predicted aldo/keto reductase-like oxidoreductase